jgi:hypothetical protein
MNAVTACFMPIAGKTARRRLYGNMTAEDASLAHPIAQTALPAPQFLGTYQQPKMELQTVQFLSDFLDLASQSHQLGGVLLG